MTCSAVSRPDPGRLWCRSAPRSEQRQCLQGSGSCPRSYSRSLSSSGRSAQSLAMPRMAAVWPRRACDLRTQLLSFAIKRNRKTVPCDRGGRESTLNCPSDHRNASRKADTAGAARSTRTRCSRGRPNGQPLRDFQRRHQQVCRSGVSDEKVHAAGLPLALHAIGDTAVHSKLDGFEVAQADCEDRDVDQRSDRALVAPTSSSLRRA